MTEFHGRVVVKGEVTAEAVSTHWQAFRLPY